MLSKVTADQEDAVAERGLRTAVFRSEVVDRVFFYKVAKEEILLSRREMQHSQLDLATSFGETGPRFRAILCATEHPGVRCERRFIARKSEFSGADPVSAADEVNHTLLCA